MKGGVLRSSLILAGATIGAGIFGIPYVTAKVGYPLGLFWLLVVVVFTLGVNLAYAYVVAKTRDNVGLQLVGLAEKHMGGAFKLVALVVILFGQWSAMLAYIIGAGEFLSVISDSFVSLPKAVWSIAFFALMALVVVRGLNFAAFFESWLTFGMIAIILLMALAAFDKIDAANLAPNGTHFVESLGIIGVLLGAMTGFAIIPEVAKSMGAKKRSSRSFYFAVALGTLIPAAVYMLFQFVVVGVSGAGTSQTAIDGLVPYLSGVVVVLGALFGVFAMSSSFVAVSYVLRDTFATDFKIPKIRAWTLALLPPFLLFLAGVNSFIAVLDVGGFLSSLTGAFVVFIIFLKLRRTSGMRSTTGGRTTGSRTTRSR